MKYLYNKISFDGFIRRRDVETTFERNGIIAMEELLIYNKAIKTKLKFDNTDPVCWVNWKIKDFNIPKKCFQLYTFFSTTSQNRYFALFKCELQKTILNHVNGNFIMSYNTHGCKSIENK